MHDADEFRSRLRVLAVDDDSVSLMLMSRQLQHCKYNVTTVVHAEMALEILRARRDHGADQFHMVITDVHMPEMDGFELLEIVSLEMNIPVIMVSANDTLDAMMKGIQHGACQYLVKPVRIEQLKTLWMHVVRNRIRHQSNIPISNVDGDGRRLQSRDGEAENGANHNMRCSAKKRKDGCGTGQDKKKKTSIPKRGRKRFQWSGERHRMFVEVVKYLGMDKAVPKNILEMMNIEGLTREHVASHLQKYRLFLKKLGSGTFRCNGPFIDEAMRSAGNSIDINGHGRFQPNPEYGSSSRYYHPSIPFVGSSGALSNPFARLNSSAAFGKQSLLPTQSVQLTTPRNLGIPSKGKEPAGYGGNMPQVAAPRSHQGLINFTYVGTSNTNMCFPPGPSGIISFANPSNGMPLDVSKPYPSGPSSSSLANIPYGSSPFAASTRPSYNPFTSYASQCMAGKSGSAASSLTTPYPSSNLTMQQQPLGSVAPFNGSPNYLQTVAPWKGETSEAGSSQGNRHTTNQLSRLAVSSDPNYEIQNQIAAITGTATTTPMTCLNENVAPPYIGSNTNPIMMTNDTSAPGGASMAVSTLPSFQMNEPVMPSHVLTGGGEGGAVDQQAVDEQLNDINEFVTAPSTAQNEENDDLDDFLSVWLNEDILKLLDEDLEFEP